MPWFKNWFNSPYYHQLYFERNIEEAAAFIDRLIEHLRPVAGAAMLDVACGKGRHSIQLAEKGFDVVGIDLSSESITEAKKSEKENLHFFEHDMRERFWLDHFDYVFNFFTSFGYFDTDHENEKAIKTFAYALKKDGYFVIDYLNPHYEEEHLVHKSEKRVGDVNFYIVKWFDENDFYKKIIVEDEANSHPLEFLERVAKYSLGDFTEMLSYQKMQVQQVFGDYQLHSYDLYKSPRMIIIAQKIGDSEDY